MQHNNMPSSMAVLQGHILMAWLPSSACESPLVAAGDGFVVIWPFLVAMLTTRFNFHESPFGFLSA